MGAISVEVVYALLEGEDAVTVRVPRGATVGEAVAASGMAARHPGIDLSRLGVFGKAVAAEARIADGDRVEIYRPLAIDPKDARRRRAKKI